MLYKTKRKMTCFYTIEIPYYKTMQVLFKDTNGIDGVCFNHTKSMITQETEKLPAASLSPNAIETIFAFSLHSYQDAFTLPALGINIVL